MLDSNRVARSGRPGRSWLISFLASFPEENHGRKWNLKTSTMNNLSEILVSVKFRICVSVLSLVKHMWVFWYENQREEKKWIKNSLIVRCESICWNVSKVYGALGNTGPLHSERTYTYLHGLCVFMCACLQVKDNLILFCSSLQSHSFLCHLPFISYWGEMYMQWNVLILSIQWI